MIAMTKLSKHDLIAQAVAAVGEALEGDLADRFYDLAAEGGLLWTCRCGWRNSVVQETCEECSRGVPPVKDDVVVLRSEEAHVYVDRVGRRKSEGVWLVVDQYGEERNVVRDRGQDTEERRGWREVGP